MNFQTSIKKNFIMNVILTASSLIFPLITFPYVSRILLPEGTGRVAFVLSIISYFSMVASLGIPTYGIRACAQVRDDQEKLSQTVQEIFIINACMTGLVYIAYFLSILMVEHLRQEKALFFLCGSTLFFNLIGMEWLYKALEQYQYITVRSLIFKAISGVLMFLMVQSPDDCIRYGFLSILADVGSNTFNFIHARKFISMAPRKHYNFRQHMKPILIFFAFSASVTIYKYLDTAMLGFMKGNQEVGYYSASVRITDLLVSFVTAPGAVLLPRISYYVKEGHLKEFSTLVHKALDLILFVSVPVCIYFEFMADSSIFFISGPAYAGSIPPMRIILPTIICIGITGIIGVQILIPLGREILVVYSTCAGAVTDLLLNCIFIPRFASSGAAFGTLAAEIVVLIVQLFFVRTEMPALFSGVQYKKLILALAVSSVVLYFVKINLHTGNFLALVSTSIIFFSVYLGTLFLIKYKFPVEWPR